MNDYSSYLSPFSWRYGSPAMRRIWSEEHKRRLWRQIWVSLARVESRFGLVSQAQVNELEQHEDDVDMERSLEIEKEIHHDLMAEVQAFAGQCPCAGGVIHLGATSMDIEDNADALRIRESLDLVLESLEALLASLADRIEQYAELPVMAFTHIQPAEPTTFGYRCAVWGQDLLICYRDLSSLRTEIRGKGFKGAVGSSASYADLVGKENLEVFESGMEEELGIGFFPIATQTYTRLQDYRVLSRLSGLGAALHKMAFDLRLLQSPPIGEVQEPFTLKQVGSSAMPFKRNPINSEKIDSLARQLAGLPDVAWSNASLSLLERTLDDSANRRSILPEGFLICDEMIATAQKIVDGLVVDQNAIQRTIADYAPFACTERVLMAMGKAGANRQDTHERLREHSLASWEEVRNGKVNTLAERIRNDPFFLSWLDPGEMDGLFRIEEYVGSAPERAKAMAASIRHELADIHIPRG
ncbi:MAG: adenylosuccinate lyase [Spirochaetaceae bacterium]|nr:adenylosuccinate lyase [Spirochaetaceae bacterium]